jgi:hypothetical protein
LLDEMRQVTQLHRKSLIRLLNTERLERRPRQYERGSIYDHRVDDALRLMAETLDYVRAFRADERDGARRVDRDGKALRAAVRVGQILW